MITPETLKQIAERNGPAWDKIVEEGKQVREMARDVETYVDRACRAAQYESEIRGTEPFWIQLTIPKVEFGQQVFDRLKEMGFNVTRFSSHREGPRARLVIDFGNYVWYKDKRVLADLKFALMISALAMIPFILLAILVNYLQG